MDFLVDELLQEIDRLKSKSHFMTAKWVSTESVDSNLSIIDTGVVDEDSGTSQLRFIPKGTHVTGLANGDTVVCIAEKPFTIILKLSGDITLAEI